MYLTLNTYVFNVTYGQVSFLVVTQAFQMPVFVNLKTKAVTPINKGCQRPVVNSLDFK